MLRVLLVTGAVMLIAAFVLHAKDRRPGRGVGRGPVILMIAGLACLGVGLWEWFR